MGEPERCVPALGRESLDKLRCECGVPACEAPLDMCCESNESHGLTATYFDGVVRLACSVCRKWIVALRIHDRDDVDCGTGRSKHDG